MVLGEGTLKAERARHHREEGLAEVRVLGRRDGRASQSALVGLGFRV